jgi:hypothetical protein
MEVVLLTILFLAETGGPGTTAMKECVMSRKVFAVLVLVLFLAIAVPPPPGLSAPAPAPARTATIFAPVAKYTATASVSNAAPRKNSTVTVTGTLLQNGKPVKGAKMLTTWGFKTTTSTCNAITGATGKASCPRNIGKATPGVKVVITVKFTDAKGTLLAQTQTSFTPR